MALIVPTVAPKKKRKKNQRNDLNTTQKCPISAESRGSKERC